MSDREKVIEALRNCMAVPKCADCPWEDCETMGHGFICIPTSLASAVYALLAEVDADD